MNDSSSAQDSYSEKEIGLICSDNATASTCPNGHNQVMENHQNVDINDQQSPKPTDSEQTTVSQISLVKKPMAVKDGMYSDPVYKKISLINGEINKMTKDELKKKLGDLRMDTRGVKEVLKKRLKSYYKRKKLMKARINTSGNCIYDYLLVIDFEATCEENNVNYQHEIIEFPIILIDVKEQKMVDEFHSYCKPKLNPCLSEFCSVLTGISQETVEMAEEFPSVLQRVEEWFKKFQLGPENKFAIITDGPWDVSRFLYPQCCLTQVGFPKWARKWVNIRKSYSNFYHCRPRKLEEMLENLGMQFEGHLHSGLHDSRNIARIVIHMLEDGCQLRVNEYLKSDTSLCGHGEVRSIARDQDSDNSDDMGDSLKVNKKSVEISDEVLQASLKSMKLDDKVCEKEVEDIDDLLTYYNNQKT
ncbi:hypothetical protein ScPMuIL_000157 [Solemya velum]